QKDGDRVDVGNRAAPIQHRDVGHSVVVQVSNHQRSGGGADGVVDGHDVLERADAVVEYDGKLVGAGHRGVEHRSVVEPITGQVRSAQGTQALPDGNSRLWREAASAVAVQQADGAVGVRRHQVRAVCVIKVRGRQGDGPD